MLCLHGLSFGLWDRSFAEAYCVFHFDIDLKQLGSGLLSDVKVLLLKLCLMPQAVQTMERSKGKETRRHRGQGADLVDALLSFVLDGNDVAQDRELVDDVLHNCRHPQYIQKGQ